MNIAEAEKFAGIGVALMVFRTQFEIEFDAIVEMNKQLDYDRLVDLVRKVASPDLRKSMSSVELKKVNAELQKLAADIAAVTAQTQRAHACLPDFAKFVHGQHAQKSYYIIGKTFDTGGGLENIGDAVERGAITPLFTPKQPAIDPSVNVSGTELQQRFNQRENL